MEEYVESNDINECHHEPHGLKLANFSCSESKFKVCCIRWMNRGALDMGGLRTNWSWEVWRKCFS